MKSNKKYSHRVNWVDGMKINKSHFIEFENSLIELINNSEQKNISPISYGLLPDLSRNDNSLDISVSIDGQETIEVVLNKCKAITLGGKQIEITENSKSLLEESGNLLKQQYNIIEGEKSWFIILKVNPFGRVPIGDADPEEEPSRHPFVESEYKIDIIPDNEVSKQEIGLFHIKLGKIVLIDGQPSIDEGFIPACRSIQSHPDLKFAYQELSAFLNQMEAFSLHIIQKIHQKKQTNDLAKITLYLSGQVVHYLNGCISDFRIKDKYEPPFAMITKLMSLARVIKSSLDLFVGTGKEDFLNYLTDWCDLNQGAFENVLIETIEIEYNHTDVSVSLNKVSQFTKLMLSLFKKLNELDYIGQKSDSNIFVKEEKVEDIEPKGRRSFLHD